MNAKTYTADQYGALETQVAALREAMNEAAGENVALRDQRATLHGAVRSLEERNAELTESLRQVERGRVEYQYEIGQAVVIVATDHPAGVTGQLTDSSGHQYRVVWWNNGERKQDWLYEAELRRP